MKTIMYYLALIIGLPIALLFFKFKISYEGGKKFKLPKGAIIVSNHKSGLDPLAIAYLFFFRRLYFLAADWYHGFQIIFKPFMLLLGAVLVDLKGEKYNFIVKSCSLLNKKKSLLVFPEGDYCSNKKLFEFGDFKNGYLLIAIESGAPIIPVISDFNYGIFKRVHFKIGKPIYPTMLKKNDSSRNQLMNANEEIKNKCLKLLYELKREKAAKFKMCYNYKEIKKGDVIRINVGFYHHYAIYLDDDRVVEFGHYINKANEVVDVHITTLTSFAAGQIPEVRILSKRIKTRSIDEITKYINETLGQKNYSLKDNNCLDYVNRVTLKI